MKISACIFDLDGVLVDTAKYHYLAWQRLARDYGFSFTPEQNERLKGVSRMQSLEILLEIGGINLNESGKLKAAERKNKWYISFISRLTPDEILPGAYELLLELKTHKIKIAIGSGSKNAGMILKRIELDNFFDVVIDGSKISKAKPNPEVFLKAALELHVPPAECIVFEDAHAGVEAARNGGMRCVGVGNNKILSRADIVVSSLDGLEWKGLCKSFCPEKI
jgi:beta-phosphoglucomutase